MTQRLLIVALIVLGLSGCEPIGPVPGKALSGQVTDPPASWEALGDVEVIQIEAKGPYSVNIWGVAIGPDYYVASSGGLKARWAERLATNPAVRLRIEDQIFELRAVVIDDEPERQRIAGAFKDKYDLDAEEDFPEAVLFRLDRP
ncbi:MAG: DUF2255 family protein [Pseudomonadota bacterium]